MRKLESWIRPAGRIQNAGGSARVAVQHAICWIVLTLRSALPHQHEYKARPTGSLLNITYRTLARGGVTLFLLLLLFSLPSIAAPKVYGEAGLRAETEKIRTASLTLRQADQIPGWTIFVVTSPHFSDPLTKSQKKGVGGTAYTVLETKTTYINSDYLQGATPEQLRRTLLHELGHLVCNCRDEAKAESFRLSSL